METMEPTTHPRQAVRRSLERVRFEILPLAGVEDQLPSLPDGATVTVTSSPRKGIEATLALCDQLVRRELTVVPHLAARLVRDRAHAAELVRRLDGTGIREIFVIAGDAPEPAGPYEGAADLLRELADLRHPFERVGVTGYPESHAFIPDDTTIRAMGAKAPYATHIVSQICYDAEVIAGWVGAVRARGITLPIHIGIPGVVDVARLARVSLKVGLGDSVRFLRKQKGVVARLVSRYTPDELIDGLAGVVGDPHAGVVGWHLFTFNEISKTESWRQSLLATVQGATT